MPIMAVGRHVLRALATWRGLSAKSCRIHEQIGLFLDSFKGAICLIISRGFKYFTEHLKDFSFDDHPLRFRSFYFATTITLCTL